jgi:sentrin-specific protease 8
MSIQHSDKVILDYNDSLLYESDLELLDEGNWLNDRILGFVYEYLEREVYREECDELLGFVNPSTVQYLKLCDSVDEAKMCFIEPLELDRKKFVLMPLNNNASASCAGGCHWSLMVLNRSTFTLHHYDSIGSNQSEARAFFAKYKKCFQIEKFESVANFPKQTNSSDCGVYVLGRLKFVNL